MTTGQRMFSGCFHAPETNTFWRFVFFIEQQHTDVLMRSKARSSLEGVSKISASVHLSSNSCLSEVFFSNVNLVTSCSHAVNDMGRNFGNKSPSPSNSTERV